MGDQEHIDIWVFDADPIHRFAFNQIVAANSLVRLAEFPSGSDEAWGTQNTPNLITLNMSSEAYCTQFLLQKLLSRIPDVPLVCYSSGAIINARVLHDYRDRITMGSYGGIIRYLQGYIGFSNVSVTQAESISETASGEQVGDVAMFGCLSPRELDIFCLVGMGNGPSEISGTFGCSTSTVETHIKNMRGKLRLKNSFELRCCAVDYILSGYCHTVYHRKSHICLYRNKTVGSCPLKISA